MGVRRYLHGNRYYKVLGWDQQSHKFLAKKSSFIYLFILQCSHKSFTEVFSKSSFTQLQRTRDKAGELIIVARSKKEKEDGATARVACRRRWRLMENECITCFCCKEKQYLRLNKSHKSTEARRNRRTRAFASLLFNLLHYHTRM